MNKQVCVIRHHSQNRNAAKPLNVEALGIHIYQNSAFIWLDVSLQRMLMRGLFLT
jgi:hypothetical protein